MQILLQLYPLDPDASMIWLSMDKTGYFSLLMAKVELKSVSELTLAVLSLDKMAAISQTTFTNAFSWIKMHEFL